MKRRNNFPIRFRLCRLFIISPPSPSRSMFSNAATQPLRAIGWACGHSVSCCPTALPKLLTKLHNPRLALAKWITDPANPLTARVLVNRIWLDHFGSSGIVGTPNDYGRMGMRPTHPELLDYLANQFVEGGFRMKPIHRMILLSNTYQQAYVPSPSKVTAEKDPKNKLLWNFPRHRLDAEQLRDTVLAVSGILNTRRVRTQCNRPD